MARIVSNFFISMDGVVERPDQWHFPYFDDEMGQIVGSGMETQHTFLMGRRLYDEWSQFWPTQTDEVPFASHINQMPKYVLSHSEFEPTWQGATVLSGPDDETVAEKVHSLKETTAGDIGMSGSATTVRWLLAQGLLDELALLVHPIAVGTGQRLFENTATVPLKLLESRALSTGVLLVRYQPLPA
jgi:dihydrofolate reductase